jgi:hypothetical protein
MRHPHPSRYFNRAEGKVSAAKTKKQKSKKDNNNKKGRTTMANNDGWLLYQGDGEVEDKCIIRIRVDISITSIHNNAYKDCRNLKEVIIPKSVTSIGSHAFYGCRALTTVELMV